MFLDFLCSGDSLRLWVRAGETTWYEEACSVPLAGLPIKGGSPALGSLVISWLGRIE